MGSRPFTVSNEWWIDLDNVRAAGKAEKGFKRVEPGAGFRIMHGLILECVSVEEDAEGRIIRVAAKVSDTKPRSTIHGLSRSAALPVEIWEPEAISEVDKDPAHFVKIRSAYCEPLALSTPGTWQAARYGYCVVDRNCPNRLILAAPLRASV